MDNKAYEKHKAQQPVQNHTVKEVATIDPFDGEHTNTEIGIVVVIAVLLVYALWQIVSPKKKKDE